MTERFYSAYSLAYFAVSQEMGTRKQMSFLEDIYRCEQPWLQPVYARSKKEFFSDVLYWTDYLTDKENLDKEFPVVAKDFAASGRQFQKENLMSDFPEIDLFFMNMRLRILYSENKEYIRMKLRTLLKHYGYKRRSTAIVTHMRECMDQYRIQPYLRGYEKCDITDISLDDMITFRAEQ